MASALWTPSCGDIVQYLNVEGCMAHAVVTMVNGEDTSIVMTPTNYSVCVLNQKLSLICPSEPQLNVIPGCEYRYYSASDQAFHSCRCDKLENRMTSITLLETRQAVGGVHKYWLRTLSEVSHFEEKDTLQEISALVHSDYDSSYCGSDVETGGIVEDDQVPWEYSRINFDPPSPRERCDSPKPGRLYLPPDETIVKSKMRKELARLRKGSQGKMLDVGVAQQGKPIKGSEFFTFNGQLLTARLPKRRVFRIHFAGRVSKAFMVGWVKNRIRNNCDSDQEVEIGVLGLYKYENRVRGWTTNIIVGHYSQVRFSPADDASFKTFARLLKEGEHDVPASLLRDFDDVCSCPFFNKDVNPREPDLAFMGEDAPLDGEVDDAPLAEEDAPFTALGEDEISPFMELAEERPATPPVEERPATPPTPPVEEAEAMECMEWQTYINDGDGFEYVHERFETTRDMPFTLVKPYECRDTGILVYDKQGKSGKTVSWARKYAYTIVDSNSMLCEDQLDICDLFSSMNISDKHEPMHNLLKCPWFQSVLKPVEEVFTQLPTIGSSPLANHPMDNLMEHLAFTYHTTRKPDCWCPHDMSRRDLAKMKSKLKMPSCTFFDIMGPLIKYYTGGNFLYIPESKFDGEWTHQERADVDCAEVLCCILNGVAFCICKRAKKIVFVNQTCKAQSCFYKARKITVKPESKVSVKKRTQLRLEKGQGGYMVAKIVVSRAKAVECTSGEVFQVTLVERRKLCALLRAAGEDSRDYAMVSIQLPYTMARDYMYGICPAFLLILVNVLLHSRTRSGMYQPILRSVRGQHKCLFMHNVRALDFKTLSLKTVFDMMITCLRVTHCAYEVGYVLHHKEPFYPYSNRAEPRDLEEDVDELFTSAPQKRARTRSERKALQECSEIGYLPDSVYSNVKEVFERVSGHPPLDPQQEDIVSIIGEELKAREEELDLQKLYDHFPTHYLMWLGIHEIDNSVCDVESVLDRYDMSHWPETRELQSCPAYTFPLR